VDRKILPFFPMLVVQMQIVTYIKFGKKKNWQCVV